MEGIFNVGVAAGTTTCGTCGIRLASDLAPSVASGSALGGLSKVLDGIGAAFCFLEGHCDLDVPAGKTVCVTCGVRPASDLAPLPRSGSELGQLCKVLKVSGEGNCCCATLLALKSTGSMILSVIMFGPTISIGAASTLALCPG